MPSLTLAGIDRRLIEERYIRSTMPIFWADLSRHDGNQFISDDAFGYQITVTGALWTSRGRLLDGTSNNYITLPSVANLKMEEGNQFTVLGFQYLKSYEVGGWDFLVGGNGGGALGFGIGSQYIRATKVGTFDLEASTYLVPLNTWTQIGMTYDKVAGVLKYYANGQLTDTFSRADPSFIAATKYIGGDTILAMYTESVIGELLIYNRTLTAQEIWDLFQLTKWRFI